MPLVTFRSPATLDLPPGLRTVALRESGDAFAHACRTAAEEGAGAIVWVRRFDVAEFAVILEPEDPLAVARKAFFLGMNALADAVAAHTPPDRGVSIAYPDTLRFDGGLVGGGRLGWPKRAAEDAPPDWLVFAGIVRVAFSDQVEPGKVPNAAALDEEGFEGGGPALIVEAFARHMMRQVDIWQHQGFGPVAADYVARLDKERAGDRLSLDDDGNLVTRRIVGGTEMRADLLAGLRQVNWLDRETGAPRL
ncbi:biotin/lipoate--protein ligase family protein [Phreatobacter sp.]|uniref:biotin/lipoate--protein ligase family protein n=1 Tax=Phreatobacter sp. TaxID=1966341 RepID=UPI003F7245E9